ncbi:TetR/AcrR family transcriptional regulator C-terminal domain-containing protein [Actinoplanes sp. NPDC026619]|uniref:TetR/AcrR family transcriptional regulator C-terminal domain-containing protein n=1 Tax=Actinoplanes sp. NPDC026619 TaxID=3155798 RepID=UPI0033E87A1E
MAMMGAQGYGGVLTLVNQRRWQNAGPADDVSTEPVVQALAARFERFVRAGLLDIDDCRTAAFQFGALTLLLANDDQPDPLNIVESRLRDVIAGGVHTFVRAFGTPVPADLRWRRADGRTGWPGTGRCGAGSATVGGRRR